MIAKKSLGQHFLRCGWVSDTLIATAGLTKEDTVLEIGPGTGILTRPLAAASRYVIAVEKDERLAAETAETLKKENTTNVRIITGDILKLLPNLARYDKVIANIPYYLTGRLIRLLLESPTKPSAIALTIQKEVAERMVAKPPHMNPVRSKTPQASAAPTRSGRTSNGMNLLALGVQAFGTPKIIKIVPASCFSPKPKIDSAIIVISDISDDFFIKNAIGQDEFFALARAGFGKKRKTLANSLASVAGDKEKSLALIRAAGLKDTSRPEELAIDQWATLAKCKRSINLSRP